MKKFFVFIYALAFCLLLFGACHDANAAELSDQEIVATLNPVYEYDGSLSCDGNPYSFYASDGVLTADYFNNVSTDASGKSGTHRTFLFQTLNYNAKTGSHYFMGEEEYYTSSSNWLSISSYNSKILINDYDWSQDEIDYFNNHFQYCSSPTLQHEYTYTYTNYSFVITEKEDIPSNDFCYVLTQLKSLFFDEDAWKDGSFSKSKKVIYFYLTSANSKMENVISKYYQATWSLSWKDVNNTVDLSSTSLDIKLSNTGLLQASVPFLSASSHYYLSKDHYSFRTSPDISEKMLDCWSDWRPRKDEVFYLYVRACFADGSYTNYTIFQCYPDGRIGKVYGRDNDWNKTEDYKDENGDYSDGTVTDENGGASSSDSSFNPDSDDVSSGTTNPYDGYTSIGSVDGSSLAANLNSCVQVIGNIPALFAKIVTWFPSEIIVLISTGFGLIVVCGIIKWFL